MCRYYDADSGEVLIDGKNVKNYNLQELRRNVGITMQEAFLFSESESMSFFVNVFFDGFLSHLFLSSEYTADDALSASLSCT